MIERYGGIIEALLTGGLVLAFCVYQYWATSRAAAADDRSDRDARHAVGEHPLDDGRDETIH